MQLSVALCSIIKVIDYEFYEYWRLNTMQILHNANSTTLWHDIIHDAVVLCDAQLEEELESYLVFLMIRYTSKPEVIKHIVANDFLTGLNLRLSQKQQMLQEVGDKCLIYTGLFPKIAEKRLVQINYFVKIGQSSYATISKRRNDLYEGLAKQFVSLMDVLQALRQYSSQYPDLLPLEAYELWTETGSRRALNILKKYTRTEPLILGKSQK
jgi:hypothetical protein